MIKVGTILRVKQKCPLWDFEPNDMFILAELEVGSLLMFLDFGSSNYYIVLYKDKVGEVSVVRVEPRP